MSVRVGVFQGIVPTLWRDVPANALYFGAYEGVKRALPTKDGKLGTSQACRYHFCLVF
jgi:hypothetical protein